MKKITLFIFASIFFLSGVYCQSKTQQGYINNLENKLSITEDKLEKIEIYNSLAEIYLDFNPEKAKEYLDKIDKLPKKPKVILSPELEASINNNYGAAYYYLNDLKKSAKYYEKELKILESIGDAKKLGESEFNLATIYNQNGKRNNAIEHYEKCENYAIQSNNKDLKLHCYKALYETYNNKGIGQNKGKALDYLQKYFMLKDEQFASEANEKISILRGKYHVEITKRKKTEVELNEVTEILEIVEYQNKILLQDSLLKAQEIENLKLVKEQQAKDLEIKEKDAKINEARIEKQKQILFFVLGIGALIIIVALWMFLLYRKIRGKNKILKEQKHELINQRDEIEIKNIQITDSINYAERIQKAILIPETEIQKYFPEMFVFFRPRDIVSGDFYWSSKIEDQHIIAAIDCTGHGVPGAFLSMIGNTLLNQIVNENKITEPDKILLMLHEGILDALQQNKDKTETEDGMDMSLCSINKKNNIIKFSGAKNNVYIMQGEELKMLRADYHSIGGKPLRNDMKINFSLSEFVYDENTSIYMLSDGYLDQFGGENNEKFNTPRFKKILQENINTPMQEQKQIFSQTMNQWMGNCEQLDDMLILGIKL